MSQKKNNANWKTQDARLTAMGKNIADEINACKERYQEELDNMNWNKVGRPFKLSDTMVYLAAVLTSFFPYRQLAGFLESLLGIHVHYTAIQKRVKNVLKTWKRKEVKGGILFYLDNLLPGNYFIDSTGMSTRKKGDWRTIKFQLKKTKKWYKFHTLCNEKGVIVAFALTENDIGDSELAEDFMNVLPEGSTLYGDKGYCSRKNFNIASARKITFHSPPKCNATTRSKGSPGYRKEVKLLKELGYDQWKVVTGYKARFNKEFVYSRIKTLFGEETRAETLTGVAVAMLVRVTMCNSVLQGR